MNVLYFGSTEGTASALHYYTGLLRLGLTALPYDPRYFEATGPMDRLRMRLAKAPSEARRARAARALMSLCQDNPFDLVFVMAENFLDGETIRKIRGSMTKPPKFLYHSHDNNYSAGVLKPDDFFENTLCEYDVVFTTKSQNVARYRADGIREAHYLPSAYEPTVHRPVIGEESRLGGRSFDAVFIGTYDKSRDAYVEAVGWERLHIWGDSWQKYPRLAEHRDRIAQRPLYYLELADVLSHTRAALGLLREEAQDLHTQRTFEIPACGSLQIAPRNDEILSFFEEGKEILCFGSPEELGEKVAWCLKHERAARSVAERGHRRCLEGGHTYVDRVSQMLKIATSTAAAQKRRSAR